MATHLTLWQADIPAGASVHSCAHSCAKGWPAYFSERNGTERYPKTRNGRISRLRIDSEVMMKRARFDPGYERRKVQRRQAVLSNLQDKAADFCRSVADALTSPDVNLTEPIFDPLSLDLILVAALGGLEGIECLKASLGLVPKQFMAERSMFIQKIVNSNLTADKQLSAKQLETLTCLLSASNYAKHHVPSQAYLSSLRQVSEDTGVAHTAFLAPPVSQCIIPECQGSLSRHHPLVTVTVFTLADGPTPATKCCLKCSSCATIYNYAKYGKKATEGERYYKEPRQYVEVSDVVYCERQLFQLYGLLR